MPTAYTGLQFLPSHSSNYGRQGYQYMQPRSGNDGNDSDSEDEENEALFQKEPEVVHTEIIEELKGVVLAGKRDEPEKSEEEKTRLAKSEEVVLDDSDSDESEVEPQDFDLVLGQYDEVQRTKNKLGRRYRCKLSKVIFRIAKRDYVAAKLNAEIEY